MDHRSPYYVPKARNMAALSPIDDAMRPDSVPFAPTGEFASLAESLDKVPIYLYKAFSINTRGYFHQSWFKSEMLANSKTELGDIFSHDESVAARQLRSVLVENSNDRVESNMIVFNNSFIHALQDAFRLSVGKDASPTDRIYIAVIGTQNLPKNSFLCAKEVSKVFQPVTRRHNLGRIQGWALESEYVAQGALHVDKTSAGITSLASIQEDVLKVWPQFAMDAKSALAMKSRMENHRRAVKSPPPSNGKQSPSVVEEIAAIKSVAEMFKPEWANAVVQLNLFALYKRDLKELIALDAFKGENWTGLVKADRRKLVMYHDLVPEFGYFNQLMEDILEYQQSVPEPEARARLDRLAAVKVKGGESSGQLGSSTIDAKRVSLDDDIDTKNVDAHKDYILIESSNDEADAEGAQDAQDDKEVKKRVSIESALVDPALSLEYPRGNSASVQQESSKAAKKESAQVSATTENIGITTQDGTIDDAASPAMGETMDYEYTPAKDNTMVHKPVTTQGNTMDFQHSAPQDNLAATRPSTAQNGMAANNPFVSYAPENYLASTEKKPDDGFSTTRHKPVSTRNRTNNPTSSSQPMSAKAAGKRRLDTLNTGQPESSAAAERRAQSELTMDIIAAAQAANILTGNLGGVDPRTLEEDFKRVISDFVNDHKIPGVRHGTSTNPTPTVLTPEASEHASISVVVPRMSELATSQSSQVSRPNTNTVCSEATFSTGGTQASQSQSSSRSLRPLAPAPVVRPYVVSHVVQPQDGFASQQATIHQPGPSIPQEGPSSLQPGSSSHLPGPSSHQLISHTETTKPRDRSRMKRRLDLPEPTNEAEKRQRIAQANAYAAVDKAQDLWIDMQDLSQVPRSPHRSTAYQNVVANANANQPIQHYLPALATMPSQTTLNSYVPTMNAALPMSATIARPPTPGIQNVSPLLLLLHSHPTPPKKSLDHVSESPGHAMMKDFTRLEHLFGSTINEVVIERPMPRTPVIGIVYSSDNVWELAVCGMYFLVTKLPVLDPVPDVIEYIAYRVNLSEADGERVFHGMKIDHPATFVNLQWIQPPCDSNKYILWQIGRYVILWSLVRVINRNAAPYLLMTYKSETEAVFHFFQLKNMAGIP